MDTETAQVDGVTSTLRDLRALPAPKGPIMVSVYGFRDQTGQYKQLPNVSSFSTAVSQGGASMLIQALKESRWFVPVEREGLQDILTERKIIRAALPAGAEGDQQLPSLATAQIVLQGGIVGYDTNVVTGGAGAAYFGFSTSGQIRKDRISVYLRAVDVRSGLVLSSVSVNKTVYSEELRSGFYRFLSYKRLAEAEVGMTTNEPVQLCLTQAIEKAVSSLILQGVHDQLWTVANPEDLQSPLLLEYLEDRQRPMAAEEMDISLFGN